MIFAYSLTHLTEMLNRVSSVAVKRGCTLTLYKNGNLVDMIMEIQVN